MPSEIVIFGLVQKKIDRNKQLMNARIEAELLGESDYKYYALLNQFASEDAMEKQQQAKE